jgi:hypothetical protein
MVGVRNIAAGKGTEKSPESRSFCYVLPSRHQQQVVRRSSHIYAQSYLVHLGVKAGHLLNSFAASAANGKMLPDINKAGIETLCQKRHSVQYEKLNYLSARLRRAN